MSSERLTLALAEFQALRNEINLKLQMFYQIYAIYFTALGLFYGYVFVNKIIAFVLAVPLVTLALFLRLHYDQLMIERIAKYLTSLSETQLPKIIAASSTDTSQDLPDVMQWEQYNRRKPLRRYYKGSIFLVFVVLSVFPPTIYNVYAITPYCVGSYRSALPICALWISLAVNSVIGFWMAFRIIRDDY